MPTTQYASVSDHDDAGRHSPEESLSLLDEEKGMCDTGMELEILILNSNAGQETGLLRKLGASFFLFGLINNGQSYVACGERIGLRRIYSFICDYTVGRT